MLRPGDRIGEWVVERALGEGGMGAVYRVHSALSQRVVGALKVMKPTTDPDARARFVREAEALSALKHPAIVHVMAFSEDPVRQVPYLVMELAAGETLRARIEKGPLPLPTVISTFAVLAAALEHAHAAGVYHRDLKPANIILSPDGSIRLVDFGIAIAPEGNTITDSGQLGTLAYLPPEVFRNEAADPASMDVYAFGLLLHEALTGSRVFPVEPGLSPAAAATAVGARKLQQAALDPGEALPEKLRGLVREATDPDPARRPPMRNAREGLDSLRDRRGGLASAQAPAPATSLPSLAPADDMTTRVPDPTAPLSPARPRAKGGSRVLLWPVAALALGGALLFAWAYAREANTSGRSSREAPVEERTVRAARPPAARPAPVLPSLHPSPSPPTTPSPRPSGLSPAPSPPVASPSPAPSARPAAEPIGGEPRPDERSVDAGEAAVDEPADEETPAAPDLAGRWELLNEILSTSRPEFRNLRVGYRLRLRQDAMRITGEGEKVSENGAPIPPAQRTPITLSGTVEGGMVVLRFTEKGALRSSGGTFRFRLSPDGTSMHGTFSSDAASSRGSSAASRLN